MVIKMYTKNTDIKLNEYYGFIYITTNNINGKRYIGQRKYYGDYENYLGSGSVLKKAIKKYGVENFSKEIIEECKTKEELSQREQYWIDYYNAVNSDDFYNITCGGDGGFGSGENSPWYGKHLSDATKEKLSISKKGDKNPFYGKKHDLNTKKKMSDKAKLRKHTIEEREKMSKGIKENHADYSGSKNPRAKKVIQYDKDNNYIKTWGCSKEASDELGICSNSIRQCCRGKYKSAGGYIWKFVQLDRI